MENRTVMGNAANGRYGETGQTPPTTHDYGKQKTTIFAVWTTSL